MDGRHEPARGGELTAVGRRQIDRTVRIADDGNLPVGDFGRVTVTAAGEHDLDARVVSIIDHYL